METINSILLPYLILEIFTFSVIEDAINFKGSSQVFKTILLIFGVISIIGLIAIFILIGIRDKWWISLLLAIGGFVVSAFIESIILRIIGSYNLFILSNLGIIIIPVTLFLIFNKILF